jgi:hypothetical protein
MNVQQLTRYENALMGKMPGLNAPEQSDPQFRELTWGYIAKEYLVLAQEHGDLEALKRALFLTWYDMADLEWAMGIRHFDPETDREARRLTNDMARRGQLDRELTWMLPYYCSIVQWYLSPEDDALKKVCMENKSLWITACRESSFDNRGLLGEYWKGICRE